MNGALPATSDPRLRSPLPPRQVLRKRPRRAPPGPPAPGAEPPSRSSPRPGDRRPGRVHGGGWGAPRQVRRSRTMRSGRSGGGRVQPPGLAQCPTRSGVASTRAAMKSGAEPVVRYSSPRRRHDRRPVGRPERRTRSARPGRVQPRTFIHRYTVPRLTPACAAMRGSGRRRSHHEVARRPDRVAPIGPPEPPRAEEVRPDLARRRRPPPAVALCQRTRVQRATPSSSPIRSMPTRDPSTRSRAASRRAVAASPSPRVARARHCEGGEADEATGGARAPGSGLLRALARPGLALRRSRPPAGTRRPRLHPNRRAHRPIVSMRRPVRSAAWLWLRPACSMRVRTWATRVGG